MAEVQPFYQLVVQGGAIAVFLLVFGALLKGWLRTKQEIDTLTARATRAEAQVDTLVPSITAQTAALNRVSDMLERLLDVKKAARGP